MKFLQLSSWGMRSKMASLNSESVILKVSSAQRELNSHCMSLSHWAMSMSGVHW